MAKHRKIPLVCGLLLPLLAIGQGPAQGTETITERNVLLILADDMGVDQVTVYDEGQDIPATPNIDALAAQGVLFRNAWSNPVCSPTRATILSGRYGFRTGVGLVPPGNNSNDPLPLDEYILPEAIDSIFEGRVAHAAFGKWHLSNRDREGDLGPNLAGFSHYAGALINLDDYFNWPRTVNGFTDTCIAGGTLPECDDPYATSVQVDDAADWINQQGETPWFAYVAFNAAHAPFQAPPDDLHNVTLPVLEAEVCPQTDPRPCYKAMVEGIDKEIGRLLDSLSPEVRSRTTVIFLGDNGTPRGVTVPPFLPEHAKRTLYEGGVNVPLIISGAGISSPNREALALVNTTDLYVTVLELIARARVPSPVPPGITLDSVSLMPILKNRATRVRRAVFAEIFAQGPSPDDCKAIRDKKFKLIRFDLDQREELYNLTTDPFEQDDLLTHPSLDPEQADHLERLQNALDDLLSS